LHDGHLDFDFLTLGHAKVFVELDGLAVDFAMLRPGYDSSSWSL
jgi:hypothetical protein